MRSTPHQNPHRPGPTTSPLVTPEWLSQHLDDPDVRVVEVDVSSAAHDEGHIPGAVLWNIYGDLKDDDYDFVGAEAFEALVRRSGIDTTTTVVFYGYAPAFGFWLLRRFGHRHVRILDVDRPAWIAGHYPWTRVASVPVASHYVLGDEMTGLRATLDEVRAGIGDPAVTTLDVRSRLEYAGERFWPSGGMEPEGRAGHVPGAVNFPAEGYVDDRGSFEAPDRLRGRFPGFDAGTASVITYCTIGARACTAWFVLTELLGRSDVRVYDGSWAEWGLTASAPVDS